jgi:recA bacterial DNA recombination protein
MSELLNRMKKASPNKYTAQLSKSEVFMSDDFTRTSVPAINIALSGACDGGMKSGILGICAESRHFKTNQALVIAAGFLKENADGILLFLDSEFGAPKSYFETYGIDLDRVLHCPVTNLEEMTFELMQQLDAIKRGDKVMILIDSLGNIASKTESNNSIEGKGSKDMTRAASMKSMFRQITPHIKLKNIPLVWIGHIYKEMTGNAYAKNIVSGGQGPMLASNDLWIITRAQEKDDDGDLAGYKFTINIEKSRFVREKSKIPLFVSFDSGINKYSGILDLAIELGYVSDASKGWYQLIDKSTGELIGDKVRRKNTETKEFLGAIIISKEFNREVREKFALTKPNLNNASMDDDLDAV